MEQELETLPEHTSSTTVLVGFVLLNLLCGFDIFACQIPEITIRLLLLKNHINEMLKKSLKILKG
jgi:hypothetical protein